MSQLVDLFNSTQKQRPKDARDIPDRAVNFIDQQNTYQTEFTTKRKQGDPTDFTDVALSYYDKERENMIIPPSFVRQDPDIPLNRYGPDERYYSPGTGKNPV